MLVSGWNTHFCQTLTSVQSTLHSSQKSFLCYWFFHLIPFFTTSLIAFNHFLLRHMSPFPAKMKLLHWSNIMFKELKRCQVAHPHTALCVQGSVPELFSFPSLLLMMPYSIALSRQFWAIMETASGMLSPPFARTERISRASLSMSFSARLFSAWIMFWTMTTPRWRRSGISLSNKACTISSQWVVWEDNRSHVSKNRVKKKNNGSDTTGVLFLQFQGCERRVQDVRLSAWPRFLQQLSAASHHPHRCKARAASGDHFLWPGRASAPEDATQHSRYCQFNRYSCIQRLVNKLSLTSVFKTKLHMHSVAEARTRSCSSNM